MKDTINQCQHGVSEDAIYKEVVVIGNGPSGIITSLLLSGWTPRLRPIPEALPIDPMLRARLEPHVGEELLELDLHELAEGLEGRSQNPLPLLMDNLLNPCADLGIDAEPLVEWTYSVDKQIDHVVLGKGPPGGSWHSFEPAILTVSPSGWLALPPHSALPGMKREERAPAGRVAEYYAGYVRMQGLQRYFRNGAVVTGVTPRCGRTKDPPSCPLPTRWCVTGYDVVSRRPFRYHCARAILATGADRPNTIAVRGAALALHDLARRDAALDNNTGQEPVLVVGSGLSAADAVCAARRAGRRVAHAYRTRATALANLDSRVYPDYCEIYKMMRDGKAGNHTNYIPLPDHTLIEINPLDKNIKPDDITSRKRVKLLDLSTNQLTEITVSVVFILIGSKPDLHFLPQDFNLSFINIDRVDTRKVCPKCNAKHAAKRKLDERQCFFRDRWHYIKSVVEQGIQSCKSRYWDFSNDSEINGNTDDRCVEPDCKKRIEAEKLDLEDVDEICKCINQHSSGIGLGVDPEKPVDCRSNPILIDKSTHEVVNSPKGLYALGPLTSDNFVRFISGGAVAAVANIRRERKLELSD